MNYPVSQIKELKNAIENDYFFEMFIDDLPMWGYLGEVN
jgi:transmembrane 9 superfamily member 3